MKTVYESSTAVEAYMILNLLQQQGIHGSVQGEYLQGGAGELQATNLVRVEVADNQFSDAMKIIQEWESIQPDPAPAEKPEKSRYAGFLLFVTGLAAGIGTTLWAVNSGVSSEGIDYNGDGVYDERWIYKNGRHRKTELDRNRDGRADSVHYFNYRGMISTIEEDDDFNGVFETKYKYSKGNPVLQETDTDNDGQVDYRAYFRKGVLAHTEITHGQRNAPVKRQYYKLNKLISSEYDTDGDGIFDKKTVYDFYEEPE